MSAMRCFGFRAGRMLLLLLLFTMVFSALGCENSLLTETEPNDLPQDADLFDGNTVKGAISVAEDKDYWEHSPTNTSGNQSYTLKNLTGDLQLMIYVLDDLGAMVDQSLIVPYGENPMRSDNGGLMSEQLIFAIQAGWTVQILIEQSGVTELIDETGDYWLQYEVQ